MLLGGILGYKACRCDRKQEKSTEIKKQNSRSQKQLLSSGISTETVSMLFPVLPLLLWSEKYTDYFNYKNKIDLFLKLFEKKMYGRTERQLLNKTLFCIG